MADRPTNLYRREGELADMSEFCLSDRGIEALRSVMARTNCKVVEASNFVSAMCLFGGPGGLPRKKWCDTCILKHALELTEWSL